jgi:hypothetical protein
MKLNGNADYCYLTTTGRVTGKPHTIEIWFAVEGSTLYVLAGGRYDADFVKNATNDPAVTIRIGSREGEALRFHARVLEHGDEDASARRLLFDKYAPTNDDLDEWARTALAVAFDLLEPPE